MQHIQGRPCGLRHVGMWLAAAGFAAPVLAASPMPAPVGAPPAAVVDDALLSPHGLAPAALAVDDAVLDATRGGFTNGDGLAVSLGIDRLVSINGEVVARTRIDVADLARISAEQARQTSQALSSVKLVQNGDANIYRAGDLGAALGGIVVQNSLNNQQIRTDTLISATVNSAGLLNTLNFQGTLQDALARAATPR